MANTEPNSSDSSDQARFLALLAEHSGILFKVANMYARNAEDRKDLMQEIRLQLWKAFPKYQPDRRFSTWMYRISLNVAISFLRRTGKPQHRAVSLDETRPDGIHTQASPRADDDRLELLRRVIDELDPLNRSLLLLHLEEHPYREIATILGITETNVATKLNRLKHRVRQRLLADPASTP